VRSIKFKKIASIITFLLLSYWLTGLLSYSAHAQTLSLGIYPPLLEVMIQPGKSITQVYKIKNSGDDTNLIPHLVPFKPTDEFGNIKLLNYETLDSGVSKWFSLANADRDLGQEIFVPSGKTEELVLKIKVPQNAEEADYYFSLIMTTSPTPPRGETKMGMKAVVASNILLTISKDGKPQKKAEISKFSCQKIIDSFDKVVFQVEIKNIGQSYLKPGGNISIYNTIGQLSANLDLLPENVLVNSTRKIQCQINDKVTPCQLSSRFLVGRFRAKLNLLVNGQVYQAETVFWAIPIKLTIGLFIIVIILLTVKSKLKLHLDKTFRN
jgi:hypothetical protein